MPGNFRDTRCIQTIPLRPKGSMILNILLFISHLQPKKSIPSGPGNTAAAPASALRSSHCRAGKCAFATTLASKHRGHLTARSGILGLCICALWPMRDRALAVVAYIGSKHLDGQSSTGGMHVFQVVIVVLSNPLAAPLGQDDARS